MAFAGWIRRSGFVGRSTSGPVTHLKFQYGYANRGKECDLFLSGLRLLGSGGQLKSSYERKSGIHEPLSASLLWVVSPVVV